jgi:ribonuclease VapC
LTSSQPAGWVLDASALLAHLLAEPGGDAVRDALATDGAVMSAINWAEALSSLAAAGQDAEHLARRLLDDELLGEALTIVPLTAADGPEIARLRPLTKELGLSLADRACLALAAQLSLPALTMDRAWGRLKLGIPLRVARP